LPLERFATKSSTAIKAPREIAHFSYDEEHQFQLDDSSLRYYYTPRLGADLTVGYHDFIKQDDSKDEHLDGLLRALMHSEQQTQTRTQADIITWRGMMTKLMTAPFERFDGFDMRATVFQGTIFIEEDHGAKLARNARNTSGPGPGGMPNDMFAYMGYKFESLCLIPDTWDATSRDFIEGRETHVVSNKAQYCSIVRTGIGQVSMIMGGEVDAVWDQKPEDPTESINYVELKTSQMPASEFDEVKFERKLCRMWAQSFLLGVPKLLVGFRSKEGELLSTSDFKVRDIPGMVKRRKQTWDGNLSIKFMEHVLNFLKDTIKGDGVWHIRREPKGGAHIRVTKVEETGTGNILSEEFRQWRRDLQAREVAKMLGG